MIVVVPINSSGTVAYSSGTAASSSLMSYSIAKIW